MMLLKCTGCGTTYRIADEKVPSEGVRVKCPKCRVVFQVKKEVENEPETLGEKLFGKDVVRRPLTQGTMSGENDQPEKGHPGTWQPAPEKVEETMSASPEDEKEEQEREIDETTREAGGDTATETEQQTVRESVREMAREMVRETVPLSTTVSDSARPETRVFSCQAGEEDPRNLARALVSDVLFYNKEKRDRGLAEGKVLAYLGKEIARSWELYKDRVGIEKAFDADYFRQAVNEILGENREII